MSRAVWSRVALTVALIGGSFWLARAPIAANLIVVRAATPACPAPQVVEPPTTQPAAPARTAPFSGAATARDGTTVVWSSDRILRRSVIGVPFEPVLDGADPVLGVALADGGTIYAVRGDRIGVLREYGPEVWRRLPFGSWPDQPLALDDLFADGSWIGVVVADSVAISDDEGRTWRVLSVDGEDDYPRQAAVVAGTLITTSGSYGDEGEDSSIVRRALTGRGRASTEHRDFAAVVGIGADGVVYTGCAGNVCGDEDYAKANAVAFDQVVRAGDKTYAVRGATLMELRRRREIVLARDVPHGFQLTGAAIGIDPDRGVVQWTPSGWQLVIANGEGQSSLP